MRVPLCNYSEFTALQMWLH